MRYLIMVIIVVLVAILVAISTPVTAIIAAIVSWLAMILLAPYWGKKKEKEGEKKRRKISFLLLFHARVFPLTGGRS